MCSLGAHLVSSTDFVLKQTALGRCNCKHICLTHASLGLNCTVVTQSTRFSTLQGLNLAFQGLQGLRCCGCRTMRHLQVVRYRCGIQDFWPPGDPLMAHDSPLPLPPPLENPSERVTGIPDSSETSIALLIPSTSKPRPACKRSLTLLRNYCQSSSRV